MKKFLSILITLSIVFSVLPPFQVEVHAASIKYRQTSKDNVPLRKNYGSEHDAVSYITSKGTAFKIVDTAKKWTSLFSYNTWYKVEIVEGLTNNGEYGTFWLWDGNTTEHVHSFSGMACSKKGCSHAEGIKKEEYLGKKATRIIQVDSVPVKVAPYSEAERILIPFKKGAKITVTHKVTNSRNNIWYRLYNGYYIYESNLDIISPQREIATYVDYTNTPVINRNDYFTPDEPPITFICGGVSHIYSTSTGKCIYCRLQQPITKEPVKNITFKAKSNTVGRELPYKDATKKKDYASGDIVNVSYKFKDSYDTIWYQTPEGYWVTGLEDVSLKEVKINIGDSYTFFSLGTITPKAITLPSNAVISSSKWHSSDPDYVDVDSKTGAITAKKATPKGKKVTIEYICTSLEGSFKRVAFNVTVNAIAELEPWEYNNQEYNQSLALECAEYSSLSYLDIDFTYNNTYDNITIIKKAKGDSPTSLAKLLQGRKFDYVSKNYDNPQETNCPFVIASKKVNYNGQIKDLVYVIIQGSETKQAWQGNMQITGNSFKIMNEHYTFKEAANDINRELESYITTNSIIKPLVVITGHSRGAATGNILAAELTGNTSDYDKVYAYLFATPNVTVGPIKRYSNIYNICNELDFVTYMPFTNKWGYRRHGIDKYFNSKSNGNETFKSMVKVFGADSYDWESMAPQNASEYVVGNWNSRDTYYNLPSCSAIGDVGVTAYWYFRNGLALAAVGDLSGKLRIAEHLHLLSTCDFKELSHFFKDNVETFGDCHSILMYYSAIWSKVQLRDSNNVSLQSVELFSENTDGLNQDEHDALYSFFTQDENQLMLETNGWDIDDTSTWNGIEWNENGNVTKIDLSYLNLSGWFNANNFPELQELNLDGNDISMLAVSSCENLVSLSCMSNNLSAISVNNCANLQNLDCSFNQIGNLNLSNMSRLVELNCYGNSINNLNLNGATALQTVRCGNNELSTIDISTNKSLNTFYCGDNRIVESQNSDLVKSINAINLNGGSAIIGTQKYNDSFEFNEAELTSLTQFANMSLNLEKLGWDLENPYTWQGVEWQIKATEEVSDDGTKEICEEYHITSLNFDGLDLEGDLCIPEAEFVESVSCANSSLTTLNLSGCSNLSSIDCNNAGISELTIDGCSSIQSINCDDNYLEVETVESSLNQMGLNTGIATFENQNIDAGEEYFNETEKMILVDLFLSGDNTEKLDWDLDWPGTWDGIVWTNVDGEYRVNKIDLAETGVYGRLDLTSFEHLEDFNFSGTQIESVDLPDCITQIPDAAFYNSGIETIYMKDGITNIGKSAFAYCKNLNSVVLPKTIAKVFDNAFMGSENLKYVVFTGDEPLLTGTDIFYDVSPEFNLVYFASAKWSEDAEILSSCNYIVSTHEYIILLDKPIDLKPDDYYHETNTYAGDEVAFTVATRTIGTTATSMLAVYKENGALDSLVSTPITLDNYLNTVTFEDVNIQYVGEEYCKIKTFLWNDTNTIKPLADAVEKLLIKPVIE